MGPRDGLAFATVAMPAHYAATATVFEEAKQRLGPDWEIENIVDFGAKAGTTLWYVRPMKTCVGDILKLIPF